MARTAADAALLLDVISGADARDAWALAPAAPTAKALDAPVAGLRVAASATLGYVDVDPGVAAAFESAVDVLVTLGVRVDEVDPGFADPVAAFETLWFAGAAASLARLPAHVQADMDRGLVDVAAEGARIGAVGYLEAMAVRGDLGVRMGAFHERYDLLVTPTLPITAFEAGVEVPPGWPRERWTSWTPFTYPFNMTQQPAASVPCGLVNGLPAGLQIVGPRHADGRVLALANAFQHATVWHRMRPPLL
jgi:aspartyl-tRNA(Asn)/glutamyl-tRNA(Gln) amidotransferase subunit A